MAARGVRSLGIDPRLLTDTPYGYRLAHMFDVRQLVVQVAIGAMGLGGVACFCPAAAEAHVTSAMADAHHHRGSTPADGAANQADCGHEDCEAGCERGSAVAFKGSGGPGGKPAFQLDHAGVLPPDLPALAPASGAVVSPDSARLRIPLPQETPVQRFDRLLD